MEKYDESTGSPFDHGWWDSYFWKSASPNCVRDGIEITEKDMSHAEVKAYYAGYLSDDCGDKKDYS